MCTYIWRFFLYASMEMSESIIIMFELLSNKDDTSRVIYLFKKYFIQVIINTLNGIEQ